MLNVTYDNKMTFRRHIEHIARKASGKLTSSKRFFWLLNAHDRETLCKALCQSSALHIGWGGAAVASLISLLEEIKERVRRIIEDEINLPSLQQRRDVASLSTMFKIRHQDAARLQPLHQPPRHVHRITRTGNEYPQPWLNPAVEHGVTKDNLSQETYTTECTVNV